jgi:hypothetical protein
MPAAAYGGLPLEARMAGNAAREARELQRITATLQQQFTPPRPLEIAAFRDLAQPQTVAQPKTVIDLLRNEEAERRKTESLFARQPSGLTLDDLKAASWTTPPQLAPTLPLDTTPTVPSTAAWAPAPPSNQALDEMLAQLRATRVALQNSFPGQAPASVSQTLDDALTKLEATQAEPSATLSFTLGQTGFLNDIHQLMVPDPARIGAWGGGGSLTATGGLFEPGGGWGGSRAIAQRLANIGIHQGLSVTSRKRSWSQGSDHFFGSKNAYAIDLSNGSAPTPQMDRAAQKIAAALGVPGWKGGGILNKTVGDYRVQLIYRTNEGGNHFNHVHVGVKKV